jgi:hypothetical protein
MKRIPFAGALAAAALAATPVLAQTGSEAAPKVARPAPAASADVKAKPLCSSLRNRSGGNLAGNANAQGRSANSAVALDCTSDPTAPPGAGEYALDSRTATPVSPRTTVNTPRSADNPVYSSGTVAGTSGTTTGRTGSSLSPTPSTPGSVAPSTTTGSATTSPIPSR